MSYAFVAAHATEWPVQVLCGTLGVSRSGYYAWHARQRPGQPPSTRRTADAALTVLVHGVHAMSRQSYGSPRIYRELVAAGTACGRHRIARLMREAGLRGRQGPRARRPDGAPAARDATRRAPVAPNRLQRRFHPAHRAPERDRIWATDATVIPTLGGALHLVAVLDLGSRHVVGWATGLDLTEALASRALTLALAARRPAPGLLVHSDQGSPFVSRRFQALLAAAGAQPSMSRRGNCWDNAVVESFFHTLKDERRTVLPYVSFAAAHADLFEFIEVWYNRRRRHSTLNHLSPVQYEQLLHQHHPHTITVH